MGESLKILRATKTLTSAVRQRHPWVFRDALDKNLVLPLGSPVRVIDKKGNYLGDGLWETEGEIAVRFWGFAQVALSTESLMNAVRLSLRRRKILGPSLRSDALRLIHGESDGVPGLVVDSYAGNVVMQFHSEATRSVLEPLIHKLFKNEDLASLTIKETSSRGGGVKTLIGKLPAELEMREGDCSYLINIAEGQKTGFYLDLRQARLLVSHFVTEKTRFLNLFGYTGAFTLQALRAGSLSTTTVDQSGLALDMLKNQARLNGFTKILAGQLITRAEDVRDVLKEFRVKKQEFDVVICDPPSFVHSKVQKSKGWDAYQSLYAQAFGAVVSGGVVGIGNCSAQISPSEFDLLIEQSALDAQVSLYRVFDVGQPPDHPVRVGFPEGRYLKFQYYILERALRAP